MAINAAIGLVAFRVTTARNVSYRQVLPALTLARQKAMSDSPAKVSP